MPAPRRLSRWFIIVSLVFVTFHAIFVPFLLLGWAQYAFAGVATAYASLMTIPCSVTRFNFGRFWIGRQLILASVAITLTELAFAAGDFSFRLRLFLLLPFLMFSVAVPLLFLRKTKGVFYMRAVFYMLACAIRRSRSLRDAIRDVYTILARAFAITGKYS
jgi:hypothetical protein